MSGNALWVNREAKSKSQINKHFQGRLFHIEAEHACQEPKEETVSLLEKAITLMNLLHPQNRCLVWGLIKASAAALE